jgi:hypothetical protein
MELLLKCIQSFVSLEWLYNLLEDRWFGVQEILEIAILVMLRPLALMSAMSAVMRNVMQCFAHNMLAFHEHGHHLFWHGRWWWWWWQVLIVIAVWPTTTSLVSTSPRTRVCHM